ncbi:hypothetical protein L7F22_055121 [Adiantum nelumboides]|nr:hypothetical protein [Adiantum nelumboides]
MNLNYATKVKEEIDSLLKAGFIAEVESSDWLFPIVVVTKKNGKLRICVDFKKLNEQTIKDPFPLPFTDTMLDQLTGHQMYSFLDGYNGYNQISLAEEDREKTTFITEWGAFIYLVMPFGLCNAPATFQRAMMTIFAEYLQKFMAIFVDDFTVYSSTAKHLECLRLMFQKCREKRVCLNPYKCLFGAFKGVLLDHIVSKDGIEMTQDKIKAIQEAVASTNAGEVSSFLGYVKFYRRCVAKLAELASPMYALIKKAVVFTSLADGWSGPYVILRIYKNGLVKLKDLKGMLLPDRVNRGKLKKYYPRNPESQEYNKGPPDKQERELQEVPDPQEEERDVQKSLGGQEGEGLREYPGTQERGAKKSIPPEHQEEKEEGLQRNPEGQEGEENLQLQEEKRKMQKILERQEERDVQKAPGGQKGEGLQEYLGTQERGAKQSIPPEHQEEKEEGLQKNPEGQEGEGNPESQEGKGRERQKISEIQEEKGVQKALDDQGRVCENILGLRRGGQSKVFLLSTRKKKEEGSQRNPKGQEGEGNLELQEGKGKMQNIPERQEERDVQKAPGGKKGEGLREYPRTQERGAKQSIPPEHQEEKEEGLQKNPEGQEGEGNHESQEGKGRERQKIPKIQEEKGVQKAPDDQEKKEVEYGTLEMREEQEEQTLEKAEGDQLGCSPILPHLLA